MKLEIIAGHTGIRILDDEHDGWIHRKLLTAVLAAIDAGHLDDLRHFAEHGTLPELPPVWPGEGAVVCKTEDGWKVMSGTTPIATVYRPSEGIPGWNCYFISPGQVTMKITGEDAQELMNEAHAKMRKVWCL